MIGWFRARVGVRGRKRFSSNSHASHERVWPGKGARAPPVPPVATPLPVHNINVVDKLIRYNMTEMCKRLDELNGLTTNVKSTVFDVVAYKPTTVRQND